MKNNKGFSLVELIIVIAIMAILVGVMAPQLIKYIEKSNVSSDTQLADTIHTAILTAAMDPEVINSSNGVPTVTTLTDITSISNSEFKAAVEDIIGSSLDSVESNLKSSYGSDKASDIQYTLDLNKCSVVIMNSDNRGSKGGTGWSSECRIGVY